MLALGLVFDWLKKYFPLILALLCFSIAGVFVFFSLRLPVLMVVDSSIIQLYGQDRAKQKTRKLSRSVFRPVISVAVAESAGSDLVAIAVEEAHHNPWAVLFPYRYLGGARIYKESNPEMRVLILGNGSRPLELGEIAITHVCSDTERDLYRAGLCAAYLAGDKKILVFDDELFPEKQRETLTEGLKARGFMEEPVFLRSYSNQANYSEIGCVIVAGPASRFLENNLDIPVILFSWVDPAITPRVVKLVFDDSAWSLAARALKLSARFDSMEEIFLPSETTILKDRMGKKRYSWKIKSLLRAKLQKN